MASTDRNPSVGGEAEKTVEDLNGSASSMWAPYTVEIRHRKKATLIWVSLLVAFFVYIGYIVWDTIEDRKNPAASVELKQSPFTFPDVVICTTFLAGCLSSSTNCLEGLDLVLLSQSGFMEDIDDFDLADYPDVAKFRTEFPSCAVMPLSQLTVNETGVDNGDITHFSASVFMLWLDDPNDDYNSTEYAINSQHVSVHFTDIEQDVEQIGEKITDAKLPYERIYATQGDTFTAASNHMVISLSEFSGITKTGERKERERTYSQTTTTSKENWFWPSEIELAGVALVQVDMLITKFEYTSVVEVDPVDVWAIIGAVGGVWQFVVVAFGVFFIFSEKQPPDKKMRNVYKTLTTPAKKINRRFSSSTSATSSQQDIEIDATEEDLPPGWVKKQRRNGSVYYFHRMTGATSVTPPNEWDGPSENAGVAVAPRRQGSIRSLFRGAHKSQGSGTDGLQGPANRPDDGGRLPPGWLERTDADGNNYFMNTVNHTTQWDRPVWRVHSSGASGVQVVDTPMRRGRRVPNTPSSQVSIPPAYRDQILPTAADHSVDEPLPPNWERRVTPDKRTYYINTVSQNMQWTRPACRVRSTSGSGVPVIDTSIRRTQRGSNTNPSQVLAPATVRPSTTTAATGGAVDKPLPPNWETRTTPGGKIYYCDTVNQTTPWKRPVAMVDPASGASVEATHTTIRRKPRGSNTASSQISTPAHALSSNTTTAAMGGVVNQPLPPNWEAHITKDGKTCYGNRVTKETQWDVPV